MTNFALMSAVILISLVIGVIFGEWLGRTWWLRKNQRFFDNRKSAKLSGGVLWIVRKMTKK